MKNVLVAQSGGPSSAINATVAGAVERCLTSSQAGQVWGAVNGIQGVLGQTFVNLSGPLCAPDRLQQLLHTPAAALGSCRFKLDLSREEQLDQIVRTLRQREIHGFLYIGGNDSMDTVDKLSQYIKKQGIQDLCVMGAPKTIDNDLPVTDHCPGYGSAARYLAVTFAELTRDCQVYSLPAVTIVEVMGRNAGWLTAASALARENGGDGPHLIYLCERPFSQQQFLEDVRRQLSRRSAVVIAVSEGLKDADGHYLCESFTSGEVDAFGHAMLSGAARCLEQLVKREIGCKVRSIELSLMQRCAAHLASATDLYESRMLGMTAMDRLLAGESGKMSVIQRLSNHPYQVAYQTVEVSRIANHEKKVPLEWITPDGCDVQPALLDYVRPLIQGEVYPPSIQGLPLHFSLQ